MDTEISIGKLSSLKIWITKNHKSKDDWSRSKKFIIIKITTHDGVEGWGEAFSIHLREKAIATIIIEVTWEGTNVSARSLSHRADRTRDALQKKPAPGCEETRVAPAGRTARPR